jgi:hypothetical protein
MILVGSQRGGAGNLATHLLNNKDNDHVRVEELRGFMADDLHGALNEAHAISKGTRCKQFMFSLSLNPPKGAEIGVDGLVDAANRAEGALGLEGQPRAIVIHEKEGRRHAHVVWSRIDPEAMKAINLPHFKNRLSALSKELYLEHGWDLPDGHKTNGWKNPLNFSLAEWQHAKRIGLDPREIKQVFQEAWQRSDNQASFRHALEEHGYHLAQGDRRGFVAVDVHGEVFSVARLVGERTRAVSEKLGDPSKLRSVEQVRSDIHRQLSGGLRGFVKEAREKQSEELSPLAQEREAMVAAHRAERVALNNRLEARRAAEAKERAERLHKGLLGVWQFITGKTDAIRRQNDREAYLGHARDRDQRERIFAAQMKDREKLQERLDALRLRHRQERLRLVRRIAEVMRHTNSPAQSHDQSAARRNRPLDLGMER